MDSGTVVTLCVIGVGLLVLGSHLRARSLRKHPRRFGPD
jgi:hypothetical protein